MTNLSTSLNSKSKLELYTSGAKFFTVLVLLGCVASIYSLVQLMMKLPNTTKEEALGILRKEREVAKNGLKNYGCHIIKPENN